MNSTLADLRTALDALAERAPSDADVRRDLADRIARRTRRRRVTTLVAAAAAVVVLAGGIGIVRAALSHRSVGPAGPSPVVVVPEVPLPPDTQLVRHQLAPVTTPVTATPPWGLTGVTWSAYPGRLAVSWFDGGDPDAFGWTVLTRSDGQSSGAGVDRTGTAGYVITDAPTDRLTLTDQNGTTTPTVQRREVTVGDRPATLETAPQGTIDALGLPAEERLTWQLAGGQWIHVWAVGATRDSSPTTALQSFAASIVEKPQTLSRAIGIGLTLPGLTVDSSTNYQPVVSTVAGSVALCPPGVDPLASTPDPTTRCLVASVIRFSPEQLDAPLPTTVVVGDVVAHVDVATGRAMVELGNGMVAAVSAPGAGLSAADLAALAASVRLSPAVAVLPSAPAGTVAGSERGTASSSPAAPAQPPSSVSATTATAATDSPAPAATVSAPVTSASTPAATESAPAGTRPAG